MQLIVREADCFARILQQKGCGFSKLEVGRNLPAFEPYAVGDYLFVARADRWDSVLIRRFRDWLTGAIAQDVPHLKPTEDGSPSRETAPGT